MNPRRGAPTRRLAGFTLIELLVVLVVVGVVVATLQLNLFDDDARRLRQEGERLAALMTALGDEAVTSGRPLAISFSAAGYAFWERDAAGWRPRPGDELFAGRALQPGIRVAAVRQRGQPVVTGERLVFSPAGVDAPFAVTLGLDALTLRVVCDAVGNFSVEDGPAPAT